MTPDAFLPYRMPGAAAQQQNTFVEGLIADLSSSGARFTVPSWDGGKHVFGPAPWPMSRIEPEQLHMHPVSHTTGGGPAQPVPHDHVETKPARGARCLVVFVGNGIENPWILGWWS